MKSQSPTSGASSVNQRARAKRVQASLPVKIDKQNGQVRDISATGVYFELPEEKSVGSKIAFTIDLDTPGGALQVECSGEVVRVQQGDGKFGIAVKITDSKLKSA